MTPITRKHRRGFSLVELAIVIGVIGLIIGGIWMAATNVGAANRANQAVQDISTIASNMRSTFLAVPNFTMNGDQTAKMITAGIVPSNLTTTGSALNAWNGAIKIYLATPDNTHFRVSYYGTPQDACLRIVSQLMNLGTSDGPTEYYTNSGGGYTATDTTSINSNCAKNGTTSTGTASTEFDYKIH